MNIITATSAEPPAPPREGPGTGLDALLRDVCRSVPYYRSLPPDFSRLPVVSKEIMRSQPAEFLSVATPCDRAKLAEVLAQTGADGEAEFPFDENIAVERTSGSSGLPFLIPKTREERLRVSVGIWRARRAVDRDASTRNFMAVIHRERGARIPRAVPEALQLAGERGIRWMHASPRFIHLCLRLLAAGEIGWPPALRFMESSGSALDPVAQADMRRLAGVKVVDQYGCREVWAIGYATPGTNFSPVSENVVVELLDDGGRPITEPGVAGRVVVTALHQRLFPFIRYDTGDLARIAPGGGPALELLPHRPCHAILGLPTPLDGAELFKVAMVGVYRRLGYFPVDYLQIRQLETDEFSIVISKDRHGERVRSLLQEHFNRATGACPSAKFALVEVENGSQPEEAKPSLFTNRYFRSPR